MRRFLVSLLAVLALAANGEAARGQVAGGLIPPPVMARYGLVRAWHAQVELDSARARVGHVTQHVSTTHGMTIVNVVLVDDEKQKLASFTDRELDAFGRPLGPEGAKKLAEEKIAELQAIGIQAKAITNTVPDITLYVTTDHGFLHAIDGETGATRWVAPVGRSDFPTFAPAANDFFVAAINGITLYVFNAMDGRLAWSRRLTHAPGAGPAITYEYVHVPMVPGQMMSFPLVVDPKARPRIYQSFGRALLQPVVSPSSLIWATDRGFMYVANADIPGTRFRLETSDEIVARPAHLPPNLVITVSLDGDVYMANEFTGALLWRFSTGDPIGHSPVAIGGDVYVITNNHTLFRLSAQTGGTGAGALWSTLGVGKFLAASQERLYCLDPTGRLMILDRATGGRIVTLPMNLLEVEVLNEQTDRLFFANEMGLVQCFHEVGLEYPIVHSGAGMEQQAPPPEVKQQALPEAGAAEPGAEPAVDPFGGGAPDPFGAGNPFGAPGAAAPKTAPEPAPAEADPFSGGADPFATP
jgi:hypothetical protein